MPDLLRLEHVTFGYRSAAPVLDDVTLSLAPGEMAGLLGPNGAGKTTLMRLASGALIPQSGDVRFQGHPLAGLGRRAVAQQIAVVPQDLAVTFAFTVRQMVEMGRTPHLSPVGWGMLRHTDRAIVQDALTRTGLQDLADRVFADLSGGERQRVLVAMALAQSPTLLLLDEPTAHLDIHHQIEVLELVASLNRETGVTVLASMHDLNLAARYFPRLILFQRGIVADGPPSTALAPDLLAAVYRTPVQVGILRGARHLSVAPPAGTAVQHLAAPAMHVIAGGGTGDLVMRALTEAGTPFSAGALNIGDSDYDLACQLAADVIHEPPYAPVSVGGRAATLAALLAAGSGILCPIPIGTGNVALVEVALEALHAGIPIWLFEPTMPLTDLSPDDLAAHVRARDYASGAGAAAYGALRAAGAQVATNMADVLAEAQRQTEHAVRS